MEEKKEEVKMPEEGPEMKKVEPKTTQEKIDGICAALASLLKDKNEKYGDSALNPMHVFTKAGTAADAICVRLDDKLSRIKNNRKGVRINDLTDVAGYCVLLLIAAGCDGETILSLRD